MKALPITLRVIGVVQTFFGVVFLAAPRAFGGLLGLPEGPDWVYWMFGMMAARFLGYAVGMFVAARDPQRHILWISTMIGVQAIDWIGTLIALITGGVTLSQVATAAFLPLIFIVALVAFYPRDAQAGESPEAAPSRL